MTNRTAPTAAEVFGIPTDKAPAFSPWVKRADARTLPGGSYDRFRPARADLKPETIGEILRRTLPPVVR
jgi:hypothetical protein